MPTLRDVVRWRAAIATVGERPNQAKRAVVAALPPAIRVAALKIPEGAAKQRAATWLERLVLEQLALERIVRQGGERVAGLGPLEGAERQRVSMGRCGHLLHVWGVLDIRFAKLAPATVPVGWDALEIQCASCGKDVASYFVVERDTVAGEWLRITFAPGLDGSPINLAWPARRFDGAGNPSRPTYALAPLETLEIRSLALWRDDPDAFPAKVTNRYLRATETDPAE